MARPLASIIILPSDTGNTGKKVRTQTRVVGPDTVHEHFYIPVSKELIEGIYCYVPTAAQSVQASAQNGTSTGFAWIAMPSGQSKRARIRRFEVVFEQGAAPTADHLTLPRIALQRFTFTGSPSGASITPAKRRESDAANAFNFYTASTGMTVSLVSGAIALTWLPPGIDFATAVGQNVVSKVNAPFAPQHEDEYLDFQAGEGWVLFQPDAGTTSDVRRFNFKAIVDQYDNA
jgi:hypothetical protein